MQAAYVWIEVEKFPKTFHTLEKLKSNCRGTPRVLLPTMIPCVPAKSAVATSAIVCFDTGFRPLPDRTARDSVSSNL